MKGSFVMPLCQPVLSLLRHSDPQALLQTKEPQFFSLLTPFFTGTGIYCPGYSSVRRSLVSGEAGPSASENPLTVIYLYWMAPEFRGFNMFSPALKFHF